MRHYEKFWNERLDTLETILNAEDSARTETSEQNENIETEEEKEPSHERIGTHYR